MMHIPFPYLFKVLAYGLYIKAHLMEQGYDVGAAVMSSVHKGGQKAC